LTSTEHYIADEAAMRIFGAQLATTLSKPSVVTLSGELGAGKSVLARALIHALGHVGAVKSPTYTLVETYEAGKWRVAHMDLYRLQDPDELQFVGFRDIVANSDLLIVEWPEQAASALPTADLAVTITYAEADGAGRYITIDRPR